MPDKDTTPPDHTDLSELQDAALRLMRYANNLTPYKLDDPLDPMVEAALDSWVNEYAQPPVVADEELDETLDKILDKLTENDRYRQSKDLAEAKSALLRREQRLVAEAEKAARKKIILHFRKVAQFQKDRGYGCERILGETDIMARNDWQIDERYRDE